MKKIFIVMITLLGLFSGSCNKWLELKPQNGITGEDFWKTKEQLNAAVIGIYGSMQAAPLVRNLFVWGEARADMLAPTIATTIDEQNLMTTNVLANNGYTSWSSLYVTINFCNMVIQQGPKVIESDPTLSEASMNAYVGEAYAIRALMYFYLLRIWGEVPLKLNPSYTDADVERIAKSSKEDVYKQIIADLDFAEKNVVASYGNNDKDKGRVTRYTVNAIQADAYLWMEDYQNCLNACNKIIGSGKFGLVTEATQSRIYSLLYYIGNSNEGIFELQFDEQMLNPFYSLLLDDRTRRFEANSVVPDNIYTVDLNNPANYDFRASGFSFNAAANNIIWKYSGLNGGQGDLTALPAASFTGNWIFYRYADILLMKAEALTWLDHGAEALELVKTIRTRAHALAGTEANPDPTDKEGVSEYILDERAREFSFEGKRWFDVLRNAKRNNYTTSLFNKLIDIVLVNAPGNNQQSVRAKYRDFNSHYLPVNADEIIRGGALLEQNPFYK